MEVLRISSQRPLSMVCRWTAERPTYPEQLGVVVGRRCRGTTSYSFSHHNVSIEALLKTKETRQFACCIEKLSF